MSINLVECSDVSATTDAHGYFSYTFAGDVTQVLATANLPQTVTEAALQSTTPIVCVTTEITGARTVRCRVFNRGPSNTLIEAANIQVTITLLGIHQP